MMPTTVNLSVIILARPHEPLLKKAQQSAQFAAEILIIKKETISDFAQVRNQALQKARHEWVLFLDSDEEIAQMSIPEIKKIVSANQLDGVYLDRQDVFYQKKLNFGESGHQKILRLGKKSKLCWQRPVHEVATLKDSQSKTLVSKIKIFHHPHPSLSEFLQKIRGYAELDANYRIQSGQKFKLWQLIFYPPGKFIYNYFLKLGCLDGWRGLNYAWMMSLHSFMVRVFEYELKQQL